MNGKSVLRKEMSSLDLLFLQKELELLISGRVEKIHQSGKALQLEIFLSGKGSFLLYFEPGKIFVSEYKRKFPGAANFCQFLRKYLSKQKILGIRQYDFERILEVTTEQYVLIFELFSKGNIILCDRAYNILMPLEPQVWKDRKLLPKKPYQYPPSAANPFALSINDLKFLLHKSEKSIAAFLAAELSLSGVYAEEICACAGIEKSKICNNISEDELLRIYESMHSLLKQKLNPQLILENEKIIGFAPFDMKIYEGREKKYLQSFNHAIDEFFTEKESLSVNAKQEKDFSERLNKLERIKEKQEKALQQLAQQEQDARKKADLIYKNFELIKNISSAVEKAIKQKLTLNQIKAELSNVKDIKKTGAVVVLEVNGQDIAIDFRKSPQRNANEYFSMAKKFRRKALSAEEMLKKINSKIKMLKSGEMPQQKIEKPRKKIRGRWYEKFRWFYTSEGFLVIAGRDATQNEIIFKKQLEQKDIVLHADVVGAPLTVIKSEGREISESAIKEAAEFAASYSSAWKALAAADVYWVKPEQISKTPPAGEYLPKGAFMIRGEKNYLKKIMLIATIGIVIDEEKQYAKPICGSAKSVSKNAKYFVTVFPGSIQQQELAQQIKSKILQKALPEDKPLIEAVAAEEIQRLLPAGGGRILE